MIKNDAVSCAQMFGKALLVQPHTSVIKFKNVLVNANYVT